jgi:RecB family endonuclease NucS
MNAIKKVRRYMLANPKSEASKVLGRLVAALADERPFALGDLYALDLEAFELAMELMRDWRLDRYYASRIKLLDTVLVDVLPELNT